MSDLKSVTSDEIKKIILKSKSSNVNCILTWLLFKWIDTLITSITKFYNMSLPSGAFPDIFKKVYATPKLKKAELDKESYANYRPISNLEFMGKVLVHVVLSQLQQHLDNEPALNPFQTANRHHLSTETALLKFTNDILAEKDHKQLTLLVLLNFSAAFDTTEHNTLIKRLRRRTFNISSTALKWFNSYVSNREQSVHIDASKISSSTVKRGISQGSVLAVYCILCTPYLCTIIIVKNH